MVSVFRAVALTVALLGSPFAASAAAITETDDTFSFSMNGTEVTISRNGQTCPPSCVQPIQVAPGVETLAELEVISFLQDSVSSGSGLLVDVRLPAAYSSGSMPGAVNVPVATFRPANPYRDDLLSALRVANVEASPSFGNAYSLVIFAKGPDDKDAVLAIKSLLDAGYPAEKIKYYRGGVSVWSMLGLALLVSP